MASRDGSPSATITSEPEKVRWAALAAAAVAVVATEGRVSATVLGLALALLTSSVTQGQDRPWTIQLDTLAYTDTDATQVLSPQLGVRRELDAEGGHASVRATVDAISSASVDVVSHATQGFGEVRYQADLSFAKRFGDHLPGLTYRFSLEPDYQSHAVGASLQSRLGTADSVLAIGYVLGLDSVTRSGSSRDAFHARLTTHTSDISFTQNLSGRTLLRAAYTFTYQNGYMEKPYRHVPLFRTGTLDGQSLNLGSFDALRLPVRPPEEVPDRRHRHAVALRLLHFIPGPDLTLKFDYQFYADSWDVQAHTLEPSMSWAVSHQVDLGLWVRVYRQNAASFWERTYEVPNAQTVPQYRTVDRDLSPYTAMTGGLRVGWHNERWGFYAEGSYVHTIYDDFLYRERLGAIVVQTGIKVQL